MNSERRKTIRRKDYFTRSTDFYSENKRIKDRRQSVELEKKVISKIEVRSPYYALTNLEEIENGLKANIPIEQPLLNEVAPITSGETARHLAILGSCTIALQRNTAKCYYLATKATYQRHIDTITTKDLVGIAKVIDIEKRKAIAHTELRTRKNQLITSLVVEYSILSKEVFERQFKKYKLDLRKTNNGIDRQNFYKQFDFAPKFEKQERDVKTFNIGKIKPEMCMGHFPMYPALPVAFCSTMLINLAIRSIFKNEEKFYVESSFMTANNIVFSDTETFIRIKLLSCSDNLFHFQASIVEAETDKILMELNPLILRRC